MVSVQEFVEGLLAEGHHPTVADGFVVFDYDVPIGPLLGERVRLAFKSPEGFPAACPSGPCVSPRILPLNTSTNQPPLGGIHASPVPAPAEEWEYWSRPFPAWRADLAVSDYMAHIRRLFHEIPEDAIQRRTE